MLIKLTMITLGYSVVAVIELISSIHLWVCRIDVKGEWVWSSSYSHTTGKRLTDVNSQLVNYSSVKTHKTVEPV